VGNRLTGAQEPVDIVGPVDPNSVSRRCRCLRLERDRLFIAIQVDGILGRLQNRDAWGLARGTDVDGDPLFGVGLACPGREGVEDDDIGARRRKATYEILAGDCFAIFALTVNVPPPVL
jgi:hypothetical protein